ncbi:hypothetical protein D1872_37920 [compost metagenome]
MKSYDDELKELNRLQKLREERARIDREISEIERRRQRSHSHVYSRSYESWEDRLNRPTIYFGPFAPDQTQDLIHSIQGIKKPNKKDRPTGYYR